MKNRFISMFLTLLMIFSVSPVFVSAQVNNPGNVTDTEGNSTLIWNLPSDIVYGTDLSGILDAKVVDNENNEIPEVDSIITYSRLNGTVNETVIPSTILDAGTYTLYAVFTPSALEMENGRQVCTVSVTLNVAKCTPTIDWNKPTDIMAGTPLGADQLNAVARDVNNNIVNGTYAYSPLNGTVLAAGSNQPITVSFIPENVNNFNNATKTVNINVNVDKTMVAEFAGTPVNGSAPLVVLFSDKSSGIPTSRLWLFGDGGYSVTTGSAINHTYNKNGTYDVTLFVFNETTFSQIQKMDYINVGNVANNTTDGNNTNGNNTNNTGIISTHSSKWLIINDIWADKTAGTAPWGTTFHCNITSAKAGQPLSYNWTLEDPCEDYYTKYGADSRHTFKHPGVFNVTLTVRDKCGNTASFTKLAYIVVLPATESGDDRKETGSTHCNGNNNKKVKTSTITITNKEIENDSDEFGWWAASLKSGTTVRFTTQNENAGCVSWCFGDGSSASGKTVEHTYGATGTYTVKQIIKHGNNHNTVITKLITIS